MRHTRVAAVLLLACLGGGFAASTGGAEADADAPAGVSAHITQWRSDQSLRRVQISVRNGGTQPLTVQEARLVSARYQGQPAWRERGAADAAVFAPGQGFDLPAPLSGPVCPVKDVDPPQVRLLVRQPDGGSRWVRLAATDPEGQLARIQKVDCLRVGTLAVTGLEVRPPVAGGLHRPGVIEVRLTPTGRPGTVTVESVGTTTLLVEAQGSSWEVRKQVSAATGPVTLALRVQPNRCDPHAVAEDKVGTMLPFTVSVDGAEPGILTIPPTLELRRAVYAFISASCGFPTD